MSGQAVRYVGVGIAGLAGLALVIAAVALLTRSDDAAPVSIVAPAPAPASKSVPDIKVQISGEVMFPGVYPMNSGDRVIDAIAAAGGAAPNADLSGLNLSKRVQDEARYHVPAFGEAAPTLSAAMASPAPGDSGRLIDLNAASARELETLPGIGPSLAGAIVAYREDNGPFTAVDNVGNVPGIGPKTLDAIRQLVTVSGGQ
jgi:competence protein ComEA